MSFIQLSKAQAARKAALRPSSYVCGECGEEHCECNADTDPHPERRGMQALAGLLVAGVVGVLVLAGAVHLIARAAS